MKTTTEQTVTKPVAPVTERFRTGLKLSHLTERRGNGRWHLYYLEPDREVFITRSSVRMIRWLARNGFQVPRRFRSKTVFTSDWCVDIYFAS